MARKPPAEPQDLPRVRKPAHGTPRKAGRAKRSRQPAPDKQSKKALQMIRVRKDAIIASLATGASHSAACEAAGVSRMTHWRWCREDPEFARACMEAKAGCVRRVQSANYLNALKPEGARDRIYFLEKHRHYDEPQPNGSLVDPQEVRTDTEGKPDLISMDDDQLEKYIARLEAAARRGD